MLRLPSGRTVGIMSERSRMHASCLKLRVSDKTPHHQLYPLIDILIETSDGSAPFGFSDHTLWPIRPGCVNGQKRIVVPFWTGSANPPR